jgi:hypothetical protein
VKKHQFASTCALTAAAMAADCIHHGGIRAKRFSMTDANGNSLQKKQLGNKFKNFHQRWAQMCTVRPFTVTHLRGSAGVFYKPVHFWAAPVDF